MRRKERIPQPFLAQTLQRVRSGERILLTMRVDFRATFKEIQGLLERPTLASQEPDNQVPTLASVSPFSKQLTETIKNKAGDAGVGTPAQEDMRARYHFPDPLVQVSPPELLVPDSHVEEVVKKEPESVKTPTIVSAKRLSPEKAFSDLSKTERMDEVQKLVQRAANKHGVDPLVSMSVVAAESSFNNLAVSTDGHSSKGLMQLLDSTGRDTKARLNIDGPYAPFNPSHNVDIGVGYLRRLHELFSQSTTLPNGSATIAAANSASLEKLALAAFNSGEGRVASAQERAQRQGKDPAEYDQVAPYLPETTQKYVERVIALKGHFEDKFWG